MYQIQHNQTMNAEIIEQLPMAVVSSPYFQQWNLVMVENKEYWERKMGEYRKKLYGNDWESRTIGWVGKLCWVEKDYDRFNPDSKPSSIKTETHCVRRKIAVRQFDYTKSIISYYSPLRWKKWSKITQKTTEKGMNCELTTYSNTTTTFMEDKRLERGVLADEMKQYAIQNGFPIVKKQKYYYGDYAMWILKTLE